VARAAAQGFSCGTTSENEVLLAEEIVRRVAPVEQVRLVSSGTEATMSAIRLARGFTGRSVIVKFAGCYHGHVDSLLAAAGSGLATFALPDSAGVPAEMTAETIVVPYNDIRPRAGLASRATDAAVITEAARHMGGPRPGFTDALRRPPRHTQHSSFRRGHDRLPVLARGWSDSRRSRRRPDPSPSARSWAEVSGRGLGDRATSHCAPEGPVYAGHPLKRRHRAGLATLRLTGDLYPRLDATRTIADAASAALCRASRTPSSGLTVFRSSVTTRPRYDDARAQDTTAFGHFFHSMLDQGVHLPPSAFEAWFVSGSHDEEAVSVVLDALPAAAKAAAAG
jgi:glutamate-1-semialdehyde 2,1-aminomutase